MIVFRTPISMGTPHTYISTGPFLPSESPLLRIVSTHFIKGIQVQRGKLLSWPEPPLEWIGQGWTRPPPPRWSAWATPASLAAKCGRQVRMYDLAAGWLIPIPWPGAAVLPLRRVRSRRRTLSASHLSFPPIPRSPRPLFVFVPFRFFVHIFLPASLFSHTRGMSDRGWGRVPQSTRIS